MRGEGESEPQYVAMPIVLTNENPPFLSLDPCECTGETPPGSPAGYGAYCFNHADPFPDPNGPWCYVRPTCPSAQPSTNNLFFAYCTELQYSEAARDAHGCGVNVHSILFCREWC